MNVFKFGGASVKDAAAVRNVSSILRRYPGQPLVVVVSAMGKMTNALEELHRARFRKADTREIYLRIHDFHTAIGQELFGDDTRWMQLANDQLEALQDRLLLPCSSDYDMEYDQLVSYGELVSTAIVNSWLQHEGLRSAWIDARQVIRTDARYRDARVDWNKSAPGAGLLKQHLEKNDILVVQGFIGSAPNGSTTTLGREGSDFTAAILAFLLDADSVTIWKDVPGMLNADPKLFADTVKLDKISFHEAIELAYYGASVIHPKTIKPLQNKGIPLHIRSFVQPEAEGSVIQESVEFDNLVPSYIFKQQQVLISVTPRDFSFVVEDNLRDIFDILAQQGIRIHLMENSAISFSFCVDKDADKQEALFDALRANYQVRYNEDLTLVTIRHYDEKTVKNLTRDREILLEQRSRHTIRFVLR